ncbi:sigma-70 family RNA polymerase sigma factor [Roseovarius sp. EL26]|uniref:sigma-70 family RNA polymerase sigma factor n=1 Tax=Roseovarius sp. EL26 TaxID=2126672 RepID=UPI000EA2093A|nr:sigma-70 family RNA polymerase sigma factor [Roseovarius sp. EL26]
MSSLSQFEVLLPELRAYARSIAERAEDAEDLVQDAIERALRSDAQPNRLEELRPWMFRVIRNLYYDELRKRRVRREYSDGFKRFSQEQTHLSDHVRDITIRQAFDQLPPAMREILFLVDIMGMKYAEAAVVLDVPNGTVMSRISRARRALLELVNGSVMGEMEKQK